MGRSRFISIIVSALSLAGLGLLVFMGIAALHRHALEADKALLESGAEVVSLELSGRGGELPGIAARFAEDPDVEVSARLLAQTLVRAEPGSKAAERLRPVIERTSKRLNDALTDLRSGDLADRSEHFDAVAVLDSQGAVMVADSRFFRPGFSLRLAPKAGEDESSDDGAGAQAGSTGRPKVGVEQQALPGGRGAAEPKVKGSGEGRNAVSSLIPTAQSDELMARLVEGNRPVHGTLILGGEVVWLGLAPIRQRGDVVGAIVVEQRLTTLPQPKGAAGAILTSDGEVILGQAPAGATRMPRAVTKRPFLLVRKQADALIPGVGFVPFQPQFLDLDEVGVWATSFAIPGLDDAVGYVFSDSTPVFAEIAGLQLLAGAALVLVWLLLSLMTFAQGRALLGGVDTISDFLGRYHQGLVDESRLNERFLPGRLHRLARLVNKTLEKVPPSGASSLTRPSIDDVIRSEPAAEVGTFEGISDAGTFAAAEVAAEATEDLEAAASFDPFGADDTGGYQDLESLDEAVVGSSMVDDPSENFGALMGDDDTADALSHLEPEPTPPSASPGLSGDDLFGDAEPLGVEAAAPEPDAMVLDEIAPEPMEESVTPANGVGSAVADLFAKKRVESGPTPSVAANADAKQVFGPPGPPPTPASTPTEPNASAKAAHFRDVFEQFVAARESCGESTVELTFDKFEAKLEKSRVAVITKHACDDVRFSVYVKNGRAALKATPA